MPPAGYHGRYLRIDVGRRAAEFVDWPEGVLRAFVGGAGLAAWLLLQETPDGVDPLAPEAPVAFVFSPLVGSPVTTSAKFVVAAKSPLTHRINDSLSSSHFAIAGKKTGADAIVLTGRSERPCCVVIDNGAVRFEDAADVWGLSSRDSQESLRARLGPRFRLAAIGPAGERLVRFATLSHDSRHAGRGGLGAVLGAKQVKAVAVAGDRLASVADPEGLIDAARKLSQQSFGPATAKYRELGTVSNLLVFNRLGALPTRNFSAGECADVERLAPEAMAAMAEKTQASCAACTIGCEHIFGRRDGAVPPVRLEYETLFALGPGCGVTDPQQVLQAAALCDDLGLDTISAGGTLAFAMECAERGLLAAPGLQFGNGDAVLDMLRAIAHREGLGDLLAEGSRRAAERLGGDAPELAMHVKGLELPGYEPRALQTMALGFAVGARGADHNRSGAYQVDFSGCVDRMAADDTAVPLAMATEDEAAIMDSLILCKFLRGVFDDRLAGMAELLSLVTGWDVDAGELSQTAQRIAWVRKLHNVRQGWTPAEDRLPARFFQQPLPTGGSAGGVLDAGRLASQIRAYHLARGWTAEGWPTNDGPPGDAAWPTMNLTSW